MTRGPFAVDVEPNWPAFWDCLTRQGTPARVHHIEIFLDPEVEDEICRRFHLLDGFDEEDPFFKWQKEIALQRFLGYDYVVCGLDGVELSFYRTPVPDTAPLQRPGGRFYQDEHRGPITTWQEFEAYPWPDITRASTASLEWVSEHLPEDMCIIGGLTGHFCEDLTWLMGYETLCYALYDQRDLVQAIADRLVEMFRAIAERLLTFERVKMLWGTDDMGFRSGTLLSPNDLRAFVLPGHRLLAQMSHAAGRLYLLHSCGNLSAIMEDLITGVGIDAKHSFEDTIEDVTEAKRRYGDRIALLGGIDVDFLCRASEAQVRERVRKTLDACLPGGGYCLGTGNSVTNYIPVNNYLAMLDEGRRYRP